MDQRQQESAHCDYLEEPFTTGGNRPVMSVKNPSSLWRKHLAHPRHHSLPQNKLFTISSMSTRSCHQPPISHLGIDRYNAPTEILRRQQPLLRKHGLYHIAQNTSTSEKSPWISAPQTVSSSTLTKRLYLSL